jgi:hypothetical protein
MLKKLLCIGALYASLATNAQITVSNNSTALALVNKLVTNSGTSGVVTSNHTLKCDSLSNGLITGTSLLGINDGIVLTSGRVVADTAAFSYGLNSPFYTSAVYSTQSNFSDTSLTNLFTTFTIVNDACVLEFDLQPVGNYVEFEYLFGSEEYPEFNCSAFNDVFGFFISGPGIVGEKNIALLPNTNDIVSINSVNDGSNFVCGTNNVAYYVVNTDSNVVLDGFTVPLIATHTVTPGSTYHLKLAVGDVMDQVLDSYVILTANSLKSGNNNSPTSISQFNKVNGLLVSPTLFDGQLNFENLNEDDWQISLTDMSGKVLENVTCNKGKMLLNTEQYAQGNYILKALSTKTQRVLTQKLSKI